MGFMYILECCDGTYYTGSTQNVLARLEQHRNGQGSAYTSKRRPVTLVYYEEYEQTNEAFYREKQVQKLRRADKRHLIATGPGVRPWPTAEPARW